MIRYAYGLSILLFAGLIAAKFSPETGLTSLIRFGESWQDRRHSDLNTVSVATIVSSNGYDGQFYAQIALDPTLRSAEFEQVIDIPTYRSRRILLPATASFFGLGKPAWTIQIYAFLNILCWFALAWILRAMIAGDSWACFARWFACMFSLGVLDSVRQSLVDLPALLLIALAIHAYSRPPARSKFSFWLTLANLTKETSVLAAAALNIDDLFKPDRRRRAILSVILAAIPLCLWSIYVHHRFSGSTPSSGLGNFTWPFFAIFSEGTSWIQKIAQGDFDSRYTFGLIAIVSLGLQFASLWKKPRFDSPWWRVGAVYSLLLPFLGVWVWSGYWAACRAVLPLTIAFNLLLPANRHFWMIWGLGNLTVLHAVWRFL